MPGRWLGWFFRRPPAMLYAGWAAVLAGLFWEARYQAFLRPEFGCFIALGALVMAALVVVEMKKETSSISFRSLAELGVLFIPLLFLIRAQSFSLDSYALSKRLTASWPGTASGAAPAAESGRVLSEPVGQPPFPAGAAGDYRAASGGKPKVFAATPTPTRDERAAANAAAVDRGGGADGAPEEVTLAMLAMVPDAFIRHKITVVGMVQHNAAIREFVGADSFVLFRFMIFCCAADARPVAAAVQLAEPQATEGNGWVKVEGVFEVQATKHGPLPVIRRAKVDKIARPEKVYLY